MLLVNSFQWKVMVTARRWDCVRVGTVFQEEASGPRRTPASTETLTLLLSLPGIALYATAMNRPHPLNLPEIVLILARHVKMADQTACLRVCKLWHQLMLPETWRSLELCGINGISARRTPPFDSLRRHRHLVCSLEISLRPKNNYSFVYPNLRILQFISNEHIRQHWDDPDFEQPLLDHGPVLLIAANPSIQHLSLAATSVSHTVDFWNSVADLPGLRSLVIREVTIGAGILNSFLKACEQLESLSIHNSSFTKVDVMDQRTFPQMVLLELDQLSGLDAMQQLEIITVCPRLVDLTWHLQSGETYSSIFAQRAVAGSWPMLTRLDYSDVCDDRHLALILFGFQSLSHLALRNVFYGPLAHEALKRHFSTLDDLVLTELIGASLTTAMIQELKSGCPRLKSLVLPRQ